MKKLLLTVTVVSLFPAAILAQGIAGLWQTIDDETGKPKSVVLVYEESGLLFGKILFTYNDDGLPDLIDSGKGGKICNPAKLSKIDDKPYCGLVFLKDLKLSKDGKKYENGSITDPKKDKTYKASAELGKDGLLTVRGMLGGGLLKALGRNQIWRPVKAEDLPKGFVF